MFVVLWNDRHADPDVYLFTDKEQAVRFARTNAQEEANEGNRDGRDYEERVHDAHGWSITFTYSCEEDYITVQEVEVDAKVTPAPLSELFHKFAEEAKQAIDNPVKPPVHGEVME